MGLTDAAAKKMLNYILCGQAYNPPLPQKWYVCLDPEPPIASGYSRVELTRDSSSWSVSSDGTRLILSVPITFPVATSTWGYITSVIFRSTTGDDESDIHYTAPLITPIRVDEGEQLTITPGGTYIERK